MGRHWSTVGLQPGILSLSHISAGKHPPCATSSQGPGPCQQPPAHCSGATTLLPPGTPCFYTCRSQEGLGQGLTGGVGPGSECCCHGRGRGSAGGACLHHGSTRVFWTCQVPLFQGSWDAAGVPWEVGSLPTSQPEAGVVCLSGLPPRPFLSAELTAVWGTSEEPGCRAPGQESYTEGGSAEQPVPAPIPSAPRGHPLRQHQFTSKTVCAPASLLATMEEGVRQEERVLVGKALLCSSPVPSSA